LDFSKIFLGYNETNDFVQLAIREKYISSFSNEFNDSDFEDAIFEAKYSRISKKSPLLRMLLLFENIDSNRLITYNLDRLIENGIVTENSVICKNMQNINDESLPEHNISESMNLIDTQDVLSQLKYIIMQMDNKLDISFYSSILESEIQELTNFLSCGETEKAKDLLFNSELPFILSTEIMNTEWFNDSHSYLDFEDKSQKALELAKKFIHRFILNPATLLFKKNYSNNAQIDKCAELLDDLFIIDGKTRCKTCKIRRSIECLGNYRCDHSLNRYVTLIDIFTSLERNIPVYSRYFNTTNTNSVNKTKIVEDVYYLFRLNTLKQLNSLPTPQSFEEMLRLRSRPEIISFRKVFKTWCEQLQNSGDEKAIELITKDFNRASEYLKKRYEDNKKGQDIKQVLLQNVFSIILTVPGYFIPFFSLLFDLPKPWIKRNRAIKKQDTEWFLLTK
jgi:hypothetical protein